MSKIIVKNPATGEVIGHVPRNTPQEIEAKLAAGEKAFQRFKKVNAHERAKLLERWATLIQEEKEAIATIMTKENGKPLAESRGEVDYATSYITWYAEEAKRIYGRTIPTHTESKRLMVIRQGLGLVAAITPWNFPAAMMTRKAAPALAAGCTFIVKPAEETPLTMIKLVELAHKAGFPEDVVQVVNGKGSDIGEIFTQSPHVRKITFTGSTAVGKLLMEQSASTVKHITMELGGHAPFIIHKDADIAAAVENAIGSKFRNAGQTCVCANRFIVHEAIVDQFAELFAQKSAELKMGNGLESGVEVGPLINEKGYKKVMAQIKDATSKGAKILTGGEGKSDNKQETYFVEPTVIRDITLDMAIMQEETFGPVAPIIQYSTLEEAIEIANGTPFGLAAYFFTNDYRTGIYLQENLDFGIVGWNDGLPSVAHAPFGGMKESGVGREGGLEGIEPYLETKYISIGGLM